MTVASEQTITFDNVSKFYGEILGVNRVNLAIPPGITSLVGPNGAGKTTLMNLMTGLLRPTRGRLSVLGIPTDQPEQLFRKVGYCSQFDSFPRGLTGREFIKSFLMVSGFASKEADELTTKALERVDLVAAADRRIGAYSKGMRHGVRDEMDVEHPMQVLIRCDKPSLLAARMFRDDNVVEARLHDDRRGLFVKTRNPDRFYLLLNEVVAQGEIEVESIAPVDDDLSAVYDYLIGAQ